MLFAAWVCSSPGRAPDLHSGGREFDPLQIPQNGKLLNRLYSGNYMSIDFDFRPYYEWAVQEIKREAKEEENLSK